MTEPIELTNREYAILRGLASGLSTAQIATRMGRGVDTIYRDTARLQAKLAADTVPQVVDRAWRLGVLNTATPLLPHEKPLPTPDRITDPPALIRERRRILADSLTGYQPRRKAA